MVDYRNSNAVISQINNRLKNSSKLKDYTSHISDFSMARIADRIANSVANFARVNDATSTYGCEIYPLDMSMRNYDAQTRSRDFSGAGESGAEGVRGVDVIDITLIATVQSMLPVLAVDFGMSKPTDVLSYQGLVAVNKHGEVKAGESVVNPYAPLNYKAVSSISAATLSATAQATTDLNAPVAPGTVKIVDGTAVGEDLKGDGKIYFVGATSISSAEVDYTTGVVTIGGTIQTGATVTAKADMSADYKGETTLRLKPAIKKITVDAVQHAISLENNIEAISFLNKQITGKNFGEIATRQYLDAFIYTLNTEVVQKTIELANAVTTGVTLDTLDLSAYYNGAYTNFAVTKDDRIKEYFAGIEGVMYSKSNKAFTYILCGQNGARVLRTMANFKASDFKTSMMDSVIGYLDLGTDAEIAVIRHQLVDAIDATDSASASKTIANLYFGYRDPMGVAAPVGYFEYLPIVSTKVALNYMNSVQFSQTVFNFSATESLIKEFVWRGQFITRA